MAFLRTVRASGCKGIQHEYLRLVEGYRVGGKNKQRVICNLGRTDLLAPHLDALIRILGGEPRPHAQSSEPEAVEAWDWGPMLIAQQLWRELGLETILDRLSGGSRAGGGALAERALVLVANRLCAPASEHGLARWLDNDFVCDRHGRRWLVQWRDEQERQTSRTPRVQVAFGQLQQWYRTLDQLYAGKPQIERELFLRLRDLFSLKPDLVFYDVTSTYFEGHGPPRLGRHGYSRDGKPRDRQVLVGQVMMDGWPIVDHLFAGHWRDAATVPAVLRELEERFGLRRVIFVGDRGMVTCANLERIRAQAHGYIVGLNRRRREDIQQYLARATGRWLECPTGMTARERTPVPKTEVQEVASDEPGVRIFVVRSQERLGDQRGQRLRAMTEVRQDLEALAARIKQGKLKAPAKRGAAAQRIIGRHHGYRYYAWEYDQHSFSFFEHPVNLQRQEALEGTYLIRTEEPQLSPVQAVSIYKELSEVERTFANLKDIIELRPIYHRTDERVQAHIFVAALACLLHRAIEKNLKAAGLVLSATEALQALRSVKVVDFTLADGQTKRCITRGSERATRLLRALGITELDPPTPPSGEKTVM